MTKGYATLLRAAADASRITRTHSRARLIKNAWTLLLKNSNLGTRHFATEVIFVNIEAIINESALVALRENHR